MISCNKKCEFAYKKCGFPYKKCISFDEKCRFERLGAQMNWAFRQQTNSIGHECPRLGAESLFYF